MEKQACIAKFALRKALKGAGSAVAKALDKPLTAGDALAAVPALGGAHYLATRKKKKGMEKKAAGKASMLRKAMPYAATALGAGAVAGGVGHAAGSSTERKKGTQKARRAFRVGSRYGRYRGRAEGRRRGHQEAAHYFKTKKKA